ncbi:formate dehydrogenase accessory sulfurtransferase FdhD [Actinosynnema sp. NPDC050801]|uniref:formate dehydrogenase accessory sulfurtransferase FdhD n=1 Tax=unclassified Actinosynnema TaxID=2637065 RepID=UPI0033DDC849
MRAAGYVTTIRYCVVTTTDGCDAETRAALPDELPAAQRVFDLTGGPVRVVDEVGWAPRNRGRPLASAVLMVGGRASLELVQEVAMAGSPLPAAVPAPSSPAVSLVAEVGMTRSVSCAARR